VRSSTPVENSTRAILVLILIFILLIGGIIIFSRTLITSISTANPAARTLALLVAIGLPLILFAVIIFQLIRLMRQRAQRKPGALLKTRLTVFFILISLLSAVPQGVLAVTFINSAMGMWFSKTIWDALKGASRISMDYYQDKLRNLSSFAESKTVTSLLSDFASNPDRTWRTIQSLNSGISAVQLYGADGTLIAFRGDERARVSDFSVISGTQGSLRDDREDISILRDVKPQLVGGKRYVAVFSTLVSRELTDIARQLTGSLTVFRELDMYRELFQIVLIAFFFLFSLPIFFITVLVSLLLTERIISPIVSLELATQRVAEGDFSFRILTRSRDELANLVDSFNSMIAELDHSRKKLMQAERITAWQEIAQRLAHEIRNPLTPIKLSAQRILKKHTDGFMEDGSRPASGKPADGSEHDDFSKVLNGSVSAIIKEVENLEKLLREFGEFAKLPVPQPRPTALRGMLSEVASVYTHLSPKVHIDMEEVGQSIVLNVDGNMMKQVFANLFKNAIQAMPGGGILSVRADPVRKGHAAFYRIVVSDTGVGIERRDLERIFDPYFTTKKDGTGLGLAIAQRIVFDHGGNMWAESEKNVGTTFFIDLPMGA
jgi:two-component system nitrogen regulation sensor histidine kinase NtrY